MNININKKVWQSKRFISTSVMLILLIIVSLVPAIGIEELEPVQDMLVENVTWIILALIAGYSSTDIALAWIAKAENRETVVNLAQVGIDAIEAETEIDIPDDLEEMLSRIIDEKLTQIANDPSRSPLDLSISPKAPSE